VEYGNVVPADREPLSRSETWERLSYWLRRLFRVQRLRIWGPDATLRGRRQAVPLLRRVCERLGLRVRCRDYSFAAEKPFNAGDVIGVEAVVATTTCPADPLPEMAEFTEMVHAEMERKDLPAALSLARENVALTSQVSGAEHSKTAAALEMLALTCHAASEYDAALRHQAHALRLYASRHGFDAGETLRASLALGTLLKAGFSLRIEKALTQETEAETAAKGDGKEAPVRFGVALAAQHFQAAVRIAEWTRSARHPHLLSYRIKLAEALAQLGLVAEAAAHLREGLRDDIKGDQLMNAKAWGQLARLEAERSRFAEAMDAERRAHALFQRFLGRDHEMTAQSSKHLHLHTSRAVKARKEENMVKAAGAMATAANDESEKENGGSNKKKKKSRSRRKNKK